MLRLYDYLESGNGHKVRLLLHQLDILKRETRTPDFLAKNPNGRIPTLELEDGSCLPESNAILWYLAEGTRFPPEQRLARAQVLSCRGAQLLRGRALHGCRHRTPRIHARGGGGRLRGRAVSCDPRLARARRREAGPRSDHIGLSAEGERRSGCRSG